MVYWVLKFVTGIAMGKVCVACGIAPPSVEKPEPKSPAPADENEKCVNCGKEGTMKEGTAEKEEEEEE